MRYTLELHDLKTFRDGNNKLNFEAFYSGGSNDAREDDEAYDFRLKFKSTDYPPRVIDVEI